MRKNQKKNFHSVAQALEYAAKLRYKYNEAAPQELKVGDIVTVGLDKWRVVSTKISNGATDITYRAVGKVQGIDDAYWGKVRATKEEKFKAAMEYYNEWKKKADLH